jgi:hypothetical protein
VTAKPFPIVAIPDIIVLSDIESPNLTLPHTSRLLNNATLPPVTLRPFPMVAIHDIIVLS